MLSENREEYPRQNDTHLSALAASNLQRHLIGEYTVYDELLTLAVNAASIGAIGARSF